MSELPHYVPRTVGHHGAHSGYDRLFVHMGLPQARHAFGVRLARAIPQGLAWRLWRLRPQPTSAAGLEAELGAMPWLARGHGRLCHFIYGEDTYLYTPLWQRGGNRSIATFHYPPQRLALRVNPGAVSLLHAAIIVGENQRPYVEQLLPPARIFHCHHPVDTDFFSPDEMAAPATAHRLVCAGSLFRDYPLLREVHLALRAAGVAVDTDVIGPSDEQRAVLDGVPGITVHKGVSDEQLRALYRGAAVGLLPLTDSTANNALLEMLACGLPVVVSDVGAVGDYTQGSAARLCAAGNAVQMMQAVQALLADAALRQGEGRQNRNHAATRLAYAPVARRMLDIYEACRRGA